MKKNVLSIVLPLTMILSTTTPALAAATTGNNNQTTAIESTNKSDKKAAAEKYKSFTGTIQKIHRNGNLFSFTVTKGDETIIFHVDSPTLTYDANGNKVNASELLVARKITVHYGANTPATLSLPAQMSPEVLILHDAESEGKAVVDFFDENHVSSNGQLKLSLSENIDIEDYQGVKMSSDSLSNKNLLVFYKTETKSIPSQITPEKIIVLKDKEQPDMATLLKNEKELFLSNLETENIYKKDGKSFIRLAPAAQKLGYTVSWDEVHGKVTILAVNETFEIKINDTKYMHNNAPGSLKLEPFLHEDRAYVEEDFLTQLLKINIQ